LPHKDDPFIIRNIGFCILILVMAGQSGKIEIWSSDQYGIVSATYDDFAAMAERILGGSIDEPDT